MKKKRLLFPLLFTIALTLLSCSKQVIPKDTNNCIKKKIQKLESSKVQNPTSEVWKWVDGKKVYYYITSDCCDQYNYLYDQDCNKICAPDGGMMGDGDGNCPTFSPSMTQTLIWKDKR